MPFMRSTTRLIVFLIIALLMRGISSAYALPMLVSPLAGNAIAANSTNTPHALAAHHSHDVAASDEECCDQGDASSDAVHVDQHGTTACKIACDLGAAPALMSQATALPADVPVVHVAVLRRLAMSDPPPPDHPPPRH